ncbi:MAG: GNAT family N-acetyltransferase [Pseudomonadota bacterium]
MKLAARPATDSDLPALCDLFNTIVQAGGTTAHEDVWDLPTFQSYYFDDPAMVHTVLYNENPIGFQAVFANDGGLSIGSFTDQSNPVRGAGAVMFAATRAWAETNKFAWIDAKIRADNVPGLAYYTKMGFVDYKVDKGVPLKDGTPMDRITKRLMI